MRRCLSLAAESLKVREYPFGAVVVRNGEILAEATNRVARDCDVTRHAEIVAMAEAQRKLGDTDLSDCTLYSNVEPCALCSYAIREARVAKVVFALRSPVMGGFSRWNILNDRDLSTTMPQVFEPPPEVVAGVLAEEAELSVATNRASRLGFHPCKWPVACRTAECRPPSHRSHSQDQQFVALVDACPAVKPFGPIRAWACGKALPSERRGRQFQEVTSCSRDERA